VRRLLLTVPLAQLAALAAPAGCAIVSPRLAPLPAPAPACPVDGCGAAESAAPPSGAAADACSIAGGTPCGGAPADRCTERALEAWSEAEDERRVRCVARMFSDACTQGDPRACTFGGRLWLDGRGVAPDAARGMAMIAKGCDDGFPLACDVALRWLGDPAHKTDFEETGELRSRLEIESGCWLGQAEPCFQVGRLYKLGQPRDKNDADGGTSDATRALRAFARGCDLGERIACNELGDAFEYGDGVARDLERAAVLFERSCRMGAPIGCANLGYMAEHGEGVAREDARARSLYREACVSGEAYGCRHLEMMAAQDAGAPREGAAAFSYWRRGCEERKDGRACAFLSLLYLDGPDGLARDIPKSVRTMSTACRLGHRPACDWMRELPDE
jgi:TPR repeat protein